LSSRSQRRRKDKSRNGGGRPRLPLGRTERIAVAFLGIGLITILGAFLITRALTNNSDSDSTASAASTTSASSGGSASDENDIRALARRSIEVLPQGEWPSLYNDFTADLQARCTLADFTQAGVDSATNLGASLQQLEFHDMKDLSITGDSASATIVGDIRGKTDSQYDVEAAFAREGGRWKLTPASGTAGCQAFNVLN
jgi:hypothetical protein